MKIVLLHGWGHDKEIWKDFRNSLGLDTITFDLPGFGDERLLSENWGVADYADWVQEKLAGLKNVILLGHSFGGKVAAEIASKNPKWLKGLILSGSPSLRRPSLKTNFKLKIAKIAKKLKVNKIVKYNPNQEYREALSKGLGQIYKNAVNYDQTGSLKKIRVPTLLIWGSDDRDVPISIAYEMKKLVPNSSLKIIENTGHNTFIENPNLYYGYVKKFIESL